MDYAKRHGMTTLEIPLNLTDLFQDGVNFLNANYPKYAHQLKLQAHQGCMEGSQSVQGASQETPCEQGPPPRATLLQ